MIFLKQFILPVFILVHLVLYIIGCEKSNNPSESSQQQWVVDTTLIEEIISRVDSNRIRDTIQKLQDFGTRFSYSPKCYDAAQWIKSELESYGYDVEDQMFQRYAFRDICFVNESVTWVIGDYGMILQSTDGGSSWIRRESPSTVHLKVIQFVDESNGWIGGDFTLLKTMDGGGTWQLVDGLSGTEVHDIFFLSQSMGWVCTDDGLYYTTDGGNSWAVQYIDECSAVYFLSEFVGFICLDNSLLKTTDSGLTWREIATAPDRRSDLTDIDFYNNQIGMVVSKHGDVFISKDGGVTWNSHEINDDVLLIGCTIASPELFFVNTGGSVRRSSDLGNSWNLCYNTSMATYIETIRFKNEYDGYLIGYGLFETSISAGKTWIEIAMTTIDESVLLHNIKGTKRGRIHNKTKIIIGAHYDSDSGYPMVQAPGADDNASGTAAVLEIARILSEYEFDYTVQFIFFGGEEQHFLGSNYAAIESFSIGEDILQVYNLDMVGYCPDDVFDIQVHAPSNETRLEFINNGSRYTEMIIYEREYYLSDEREYNLKGYPAVGISEYTFRDIRDYPWYHSTKDKIDKLNIGFTTEIVRFTLGGIGFKALPVKVD